MPDVQANRNPIALPLPPYILRLIDRLENAGEEAYVVGGSLRDLLLGREPHDYDLATSAPPRRTAALFSDHRVIETGLKHGTVTVLCDGEPVEITTFRIDGDYTDARHPDGVTFTRRITEDLARRDFTVNAMAYHPTRGLVDPFGGQADLAAQVLRAVGDAELRFSEDALRIMRAFRFSAQLNFTLEEKTLQGCIDSKSKLTQVAKERIAAELLRLLSFPRPSSSLHMMKNAGIFPCIIDGVTPKEEVLCLIDRAPADVCARLALLLSHLDRDHAASALRGLKLSNLQVSSACAILNHMRTTVSSPADARRLIGACGKHAAMAVRLSVLLGISSSEAVTLVDGENQAPCTLSQLAVTGKDLQALGFDGKDIGITLHALLASVIDSPELNQKETLLRLAQEKMKKEN